MEEEEMLIWGEKALDAIFSDKSSHKVAESWQKALHAYLLAAGGISGDGEVTEDIKPKRSQHPFILELVPHRDDRFSDIWNNIEYPEAVYVDETKTDHERIWALLFKRLREMDVPEMMSTIVAQTPNKPWEYYHDMCRQIWDEARHSMMGEVGFVNKGVDWKKLPVNINWSYELNTILTPLERHAVLYDIEFGLMPGDTGKKYEFQIAKKSGYKVAMTFHDHDWADEVLHAQIGRRWLVPQFSNQKEALELAQKAYKKMEENRLHYQIINENWWNDFYDSVKEIPLD